MAKAMIRKRRKPPPKKNTGPGIQERLKRLTADVPVGRIRGKSFVLTRDDAGLQSSDK